MDPEKIISESDIPNIKKEENSELPSNDEIDQLKRDMHMKGRVMLIDETPEEYKKEREESWEAMQDVNYSAGEQQEKETPKEEDVDDFEKYQDLSNVKLCEERLNNLLENCIGTDDFVDKAKTMIYKMLTQRSEFVKNTHDAGKDVADLMADYQPQKEWYRNTRESLENTVGSNGEFSWNSNPGWFGINTRPEAGEREGNNVKVYATIPVENYSYIQHIPDLANRLRQLAIESDDRISVKIPESLSGFMSHNDSIVVHLEGKENAEKVQEIMDAWKQEHGIQEAPREMGRTKIAADPDDTSFSSAVANNVSDWLGENAGKYDNNLLAKEAIKHAIEHSQKNPVKN